MPEPVKVSSAQLATALRALGAQSHEVARARGFHAGVKSPSESIMGVVRNLGLASGYIKRGEKLSTLSASTLGKPTGFPAKLADAVIGIFDLANASGVDLGEAIARKTAWNASRVRR